MLGLSTSQVGGDNLAGYHKAGPLIGIFANKSISSSISLQIEMTYIHKGSNNPDINNVDNSNYLWPDISLKYIEVPCVIKYHQNTKLIIEGGITGGYLMDGYYNDIYGKIDWQYDPPFIKYDVGLLLGMQYKYSKNISLTTRLSHSIIPIGTQENYLKGKYNSVLSFILHYYFI